MNGKREIFYFSGTGNSLFVARELQERVPGVKLTPIAGLLGKAAVETDAETVGFVFPLHGMSVPLPVKAFVKKLEMHLARYIFAIATRAGTKCFAFSQMDRMLKKKGRALDAHFLLTMASNDPKFESYEVPTTEKIAGIEEGIRNSLDAIGKIVANKMRCREEDTNFCPSGFMLDRLVLLGMKYAQYDGARDYFYSDSKCTGCGGCEKVCLSGKIKMAEKRPVWQKEVKCFLCYACINYCPRQAAQIKTTWYMKSYTDKTGRYPHPHASAEEIAAQKS